jgi:hypothetical protein
MNSKSSGKVRELTQLMTVPDILAALAGPCHETPSTNGAKPGKGLAASPSRTGNCGAR